MPSERRRRLALGLLLALSPPLRAAQGQLIERVLAAVNDVPVLMSDVELLSALRGLPGEAALQAAIDEQLMYQEAARLTQAALDAREEQAAYESLQARAQGAQRFPEAGLRRLARRQATILKYVEFRFRPQLHVADEELRAVYAAEVAGQAAPPPFEERAAELRERLEREALDLRLEAWIQDLRSSAQIRLTPPDEPPAQAGPLGSPAPAQRP